MASTSSATAHNDLPAAPPAHNPVPPLTEDIDASAQQTQRNSSVSGEQSPRALPALGRGRCSLTAFSSAVAASGSGLGFSEVAATSATAAVSSQEESEESLQAESGFDASVLGETLEIGTARTVRYVWAPQQARVVQISARRGCQGQAEEGNEEGEEVRNDDVQGRGRELVGVAASTPTTRDNSGVNKEVAVDDYDEGMEDQTAEEAAAQAAPDQRRNRRHGRVYSSKEVQSLRRLGRVFTTEDAQSVQSLLHPPPGPASSEDDREAPSD